MSHYLFFFTITVFSMHLIPGPAMLYCINTAVTSGKTSAIAGALGLELGTLFYVMLAGSGLGSLILVSPKLYLLLKIFGAGYLIYMAYRFLPKQALSTQGAIRHNTNKFIEGTLINLTNPSILLFFITLLPQFVPASNKSILIFLFFGIAFNISSFLVSLGVIYFSSFIKHNITQLNKFQLYLSYFPSILFLLIAVGSLIAIIINTVKL